MPSLRMLLPPKSLTGPRRFARCTREGNDTQSAVRMHLDVVGEPAWQLLDDGPGVRPGVHADIVALEGTDERLCHAVRLRAADRGRARDQLDVAGEGSGVARDIAAAVVAQPLDRLGQAVHRSEAVLDGGDHQVPDVLGADAAGRRHVPHRLAVAAVEREGDADLLAIVARDLQPIRAPAGVALVDGDPAVVTSFLAMFAIPLEQQPVHLHDAVHALWVGACAPGLFGLAAQQGRGGVALDSAFKSALERTLRSGLWARPRYIRLLSGGGAGAMRSACGYSTRRFRLVRS